MAFNLLFVHTYLMMFGGAGPAKRNEESLSSRQKGRTQVGESSLAINYPREKNDLSFDSFTIRNGIQELSFVL